jgi:signal transduction histidine kinase
MPPSTPWIALPPAVLAVSEWRELLAVPFAASGVWNGQLYVIDPVARPRGELRVRFLAAIAQQITPGLLNLYLVRRLRSRAESLERGRISRELHDGVLQSLAGIDMRLEVLRRQAAASESSDLADELGELQRLLQGESVDLRQLMLRLRPTDVDARRLPGAVADLIERFGRGGDIQARLEWAVSRLNLPPHHCSEILRIVQEALFNVRRHSGATRALVRVEADADAWALIVEDNGCGLGFTGRLTSEELELLAKGPRVIRERAVALGGLLSVESSDHGTRLEITFSREGRD